MKDRWLARLVEKMNWLGFSLLALGLWGVWGFLGKVASQHLPSPMVYLLTISGHLIVVAYLLVEGLGPVAWQPWGVSAAVGSGIAMAVALLFFLKALAPSRHEPREEYRVLHQYISYKYRLSRDVYFIKMAK